MDDDAGPMSSLTRVGHLLSPAPDNLEVSATTLVFPSLNRVTFVAVRRNETEYPMNAKGDLCRQVIR